MQEDVATVVTAEAVAAMERTDLEPVGGFGPHVNDAPATVVMFCAGDAGPFAVILGAIAAASTSLAVPCSDVLSRYRSGCFAFIISAVGFLRTSCSCLCCRCIALPCVVSDVGRGVFTGVPGLANKAPGGLSSQDCSLAKRPNHL